MYPGICPTCPLSLIHICIFFIKIGFDEARRSADMLLMKADFNKENTELTLTLTTPDYMSKETAEKLKPFLRRPVVYHWKNGAFSI